MSMFGSHHGDFDRIARFVLISWLVKRGYVYEDAVATVKKMWEDAAE